MKISIARRAASLVLLGATALILAACSSVKLDDVNGDSANGGSGNFGSQPWNDPQSPLYQRSVYFDLNEYTIQTCLLYTSPSPRDRTRSRMPSSA